MEIVNPNDSYDLLTKIVVAGSVEVGKTLFVKRIKYYSEGEKFDIQNSDKAYIPTIGRDFIIFNYKSKDKIIRTQLWDVSGQDRWDDTVHYLARGAGAILLFYNSFNRNTFLKAIKFYTDLSKSYPKAIYALINAKYNLPIQTENNNDIVSDEEALEFANKNDIIFAHLSLFEKYETGINELLGKIFLKYNELSQN